MDSIICSSLSRLSRNWRTAKNRTVSQQYRAFLCLQGLRMQVLDHSEDRGKKAVRGRDWRRHPVHLRAAALGSCWQERCFILPSWKREMRRKILPLLTAVAAVQSAWPVSMMRMASGVFLADAGEELDAILPGMRRSAPQTRFRWPACSGRFRDRRRYADRIAGATAARPPEAPQARHRRKALTCRLHRFH